MILSCTAWRTVPTRYLCKGYNVMLTFYKFVKKKKKNRLNNLGKTTESYISQTRIIITTIYNNARIITPTGALRSFVGL